MDEYASHLKTLRWLGKLPIKRVLEFGSGRYSTPLFLDSRAFPDVEYVETWEDDRHWIAKLPKDDKLTVKSGESHDLARDADPESFDLVFIDNGRSPEERVAVIERIVGQDVPYIVAIHDFEVPDYRRAASPMAHRWLSLEQPSTGVLWTDHCESRPTWRPTTCSPGRT